MIAAARCPARSDPANSQFERPTAITGSFVSGPQTHPITHKSPIVELAGITGTLNEDGNLLHAQPNRPGPPEFDSY